MTASLQKIKSILNVQSDRDDAVEFTGFNSIELATETEIAFCYRLDKLQEALDSNCGALILPKEWDLVSLEKILLTSESMEWTREVLLSCFQDFSENIPPDVHSTVSLDPTVKLDYGSTIGDSTSVGAGVIIGKRVSIGRHVVIHPGVVIYDDVQINDHCIIQANSVIGSDGFGYTVSTQGYKKIPHLGNVILESNVELGAGCTIDRATYGSTRLLRGVKLDNLCHIAHNVVIGEHTVIAAQTGVAGSTIIGKYCRIGGQVGIAGHISIADYSEIQGKSGVTSTIRLRAKKWYGYPAIGYRNYLKSYVLFSKLPSLFKEIEQFKRLLATQKENSDDTKN